MASSKHRNIRFRQQEACGVGMAQAVAREIKGNTAEGFGEDSAPDLNGIFGR